MRLLEQRLEAKIVIVIFLNITNNEILIVKFEYQLIWFHLNESDLLMAKQFLNNDPNFSADSAKTFYLSNKQFKGDPPPCWRAAPVIIQKQCT